MRTPQDPAEALAAALAAVGPRGATVTSDNRNAVQAWLTAQGVPSARVKAMKLATLQKAWNSDKYVAAVVRFTKLNADASADTLAAIDATDAVDAPQEAARMPAPVATNDKAAAALAALQDALGAGRLDEARVVELIAEHAPKATPSVTTHRIERTAASGDVVAVTGAHPELPRITRALLAGVHVFMAGPAGCGKTHIGEQAAQLLGLSFYSTGAVDSPYTLTGFKNAAGDYQRTAFRDAFELGGLFLFDEIDASDPAALLVINQALANGQMAFPDSMVKRHADFRVLACANTYGHGADRLYVGRAQLDAATLDRFARVALDYDRDLERKLAGDDAWCVRVQAIRAEARAMRARVVVSMRASIHGAALLKAGWSVRECEDALILAGHDEATVSRLRAAGERA
jgi:cobaltochelatase CobS